MVKLHVVKRAAVEEDFTPDDIKRLRAAMVPHRALVDDPIALMERARALLEGEAERLI